jgi:cell division transport system ATP-binding protein
LVSRPALLLADEPTGNLDAGYAADIMAMFRDFHQVGTTLVISTHDDRAISALGGRIIHLDHGRVQEEGAA